jgi:hypothetical protein
MLSTDVLPHTDIHEDYSLDINTAKPHWMWRKSVALA